MSGGGRPVAVLRPGPGLVRALWGIALLALAWYAMLFGVHALALVRFPYEADYGEGPILHEVHRLLQGLPVYHDDRRPPYIVANYPPVYLAAVALLQQAGLGPGFAAGRALSAVAVGAAALLAGLCAGVTVGRAQPGGRWAAAALAAGLLLAQPYVWQWGPLGRVDSLALAWTMAGLYAVARRPEAAGRSWPLFALAVLTRQSSVEGLAAALWYLWPTHRAAALRLLGRWAAAVGAAVVALQAATGGQFLIHTVVYNANQWSAVRAATAPAAWVFAGGGLPLLVLAAVGWRASAGLPRGRLWRAFAAASFTVALTAGKVGSSLNYFFPSIAAAAVLAGLGAPVLRRRAIGTALLFAYAVGCPPLAEAPTTVGAAVRALTAYRDLRTPGYDRLGWDTPADGRDPAQAALVARLRTTPDPILSENMGDLVLAGHGVFWQPFELTQAHADGHWDDSALVAMAAAGRFPLVVLGFPLEDPTRWHTDRFPPELLRALADRYVPDARIGRFYLYRPGP